jgi:transmembrane sensor
MTIGAQDNDNARDSRAEFIDVDMSQERVSRLWNRISTELDMQAPRNNVVNAGWSERVLDFSRSRFMLTTAIALSVVAVGGAVFTFGPFAQDSATSNAQMAALENATLKTGSDRMAVDLQDGSHVELDANSQLTVQKQEATELRLKLDTGKVECDVAHNPKRQFYVHAAGVIVRVTGTRFNVNVATEYTPSGAAEHQVEVGVSRGSVEIQRVDGTMPVRKLAAGQTWSMRLSDEINGALPSTHESDSPEPEAAPEVRAPVRAVLPKSDPAGEAAGEPDDARSLLEKGRQARRQGDPRAAAAAYQALLNQFPEDSRAGLAAFELGRLRMDRLGDLTGAISALNQAVRLAPGSAFREDAMARLVDAHQRLGQTSACVSAQQVYLKNFPSGVHAATVRSRCSR